MPVCPAINSTPILLSFILPEYLSNTLRFRLFASVCNGSVLGFETGTVIPNITVVKFGSGIIGILVKFKLDWVDENKLLSNESKSTNLPVILTTLFSSIRLSTSIGNPSKWVISISE